MHALASDRVPDSWATVGYASLRSLSTWMHNLLQRVAQIQEWCADLTVPKSVWLSGCVSADPSTAAVRLLRQPQPANCTAPSVHLVQTVQSTVLPHGHQADYRTPQRVGPGPHRTGHRGRVGQGGQAIYVVSPHVLAMLCASYMLSRQKC